MAQDSFEKQHYQISEKEMRALLKKLDRPAQIKPQLHKLLTEPTVLD